MPWASFSMLDGPANILQCVYVHHLLINKGFSEAEMSHLSNPSRFKCAYNLSWDLLTISI